MVDKLEQCSSSKETVQVTMKRCNKMSTEQSDWHQQYATQKMESYTTKTLGTPVQVA